jgi:hypothetical protein
MNSSNNAMRILDWLAAAALALAVICPAMAAEPKAEKAKKPPAKAKKAPHVGYDDTPFLPGGKWRVHDVARPHPRVVTPPTPHTAYGPGQPPSDAVVLFDGSDLSNWRAQGRGPDRGKTVDAQWKVANGYMEAVPGTGSIFSKQTFGDCQIHVEWAAPEVISSDSQGRGNSGVLIMGKYEIQVLDSYDNVTYADGQAASIYGQYPPLVNACRRPGQWQTYDIVFEAPQFDGQRLLKPAFVTVFHNGIVVHNRKQMLGPMRHKVLTSYSPHEPEGPLMLQSHNNPVRYRNIWVRPLTDYDEP